MQANQMNAIIATGYGTSEVLKFTQLEKPTPGPKDVLLQRPAEAHHYISFGYKKGNVVIVSVEN